MYYKGYVDKRQTCIRRAIRRGRLTTVRNLLNSYGYSNWKNWDCGFPFIHEAVTHSKTEIVDLLLQNKEYPCNIDSSLVGVRGLLLHLAAEKNNDHIINSLLDYGACIDIVNSERRTPVFTAVQHGSGDALRALVMRKGSFNICDKSGISAYDFALQNKLYDAVKCFVYNGADPHYKSRNQLVTPLHVFAEFGDFDAVEFLLNKQVDIHALTQALRSPLNCSAHLKSSKILSKFLELGAHVDEQDITGKTALHISSENGCLESVQLLLDKDAKVDVLTLDGHGHSPIFLAASNFHEDVFSLLLKYGAQVDINMRKNNKNILHFAADGGSALMVDYILEHFEVDRKDYMDIFDVVVMKDGEKFNSVVYKLLENGFYIGSDKINNHEFIAAAVERGFVKIVEDVLNFGLKVDVMIKMQSRYCTLAHIAAEFNQEEVIKLLESRGAPLRTRDLNKRTPLYYATSKGFSQMVRLLLPSIPYDIDSFKLAVSLGNKEIADLILRRGLNINAHQRGDTALYYTIDSGEYATVDYNDDKDYNDENAKEMMKFLLSKGAKMSVNWKGTTLMQFAILKNRVKIVETLLQHNAEINATILKCVDREPVVPSCSCCRDENFDYEATAFEILKTQETILYYAVRLGRKEIVSLLIEYGALINCQAEEGFTPLHKSVYFEHIEVVRILLDAGADVNLADNAGTTPLCVAVKKYATKIISLLLDYGAVLTINVSDRNNFDNASIINDDNNFNDANIGTNDSNDKAILKVNSEGKVCLACDNNFPPLTGRNFRRRIDTDKNEVIQLLVSHVMKLRAANLLPDETIANAIFGDETYFSDREFKMYDSEVAIMKKEKVGDTIVSFYNVLNQPLYLLIGFMENESFARSIKSDEWEKMFPSYAGMILSRCRTALNKKKILDEIKAIFNSIFINFPQLPTVIVDKIISYFTDIELRKLIVRINCK